MIRKNLQPCTQFWTKRNNSIIFPPETVELNILFKFSQNNDSTVFWIFFESVKLKRSLFFFINNKNLRRFD